MCLLHFCLIVDSVSIKNIHPEGISAYKVTLFKPGKLLRITACPVAFLTTQRPRYQAGSKSVVASVSCQVVSLMCPHCAYFLSLTSDVHTSHKLKT